MPGEINILLIEHAVLTEKLQLDLVCRLVTAKKKGETIIALRTPSTFI